MTTTRTKYDPLDTKSFMSDDGVFDELGYLRNQLLNPKAIDCFDQLATIANNREDKGAIFEAPRIFRAAYFLELRELLDAAPESPDDDKGAIDDQIRDLADACTLHHNRLVSMF